MAKRWLIGAAAVLVVLAGGVTVAMVSFDPNGQKGRIAAAVQRATGRTMTLAGPVHLGWGLTPVLEAEDVSLANMPGGTRPQMATVARAEARVKLLPLLTGQVEIARVTLVRPDILLETDASGRGNWQFDRPAAQPSAEPSRSVRRAPPLLDRLVVEAGRVTWHDGVTGRTSVADVPHATVDAGAGPAQVQAEADVAGAHLTLAASLGTAAQLTGAVPGPWPIKLSAAVGDAKVALDGLADPAARSLSGHIEASVPDLARTGAVLQRPDWPALHDLHLAATLPAGGGLPQDVALQAGASDFGAVLPGLALTHLAYTSASGQPARVEAQGTLAGAPWRVASGLTPAGQGVALRGLTLASGPGDLAGDVVVAASPRPSLRGTLIATRLDLDAVRALHRPPAPAPVTPGSAPPAATPPPPAPPPDRVFSDAPLPWDMLRRADADLQLTVGTLRAGGADYRNVAGHLVLADGAVRLDSAVVLAPEGRVDLSFSADARAPAPAVVLNLRSGAFAIDPLLRALGLPGGSDAAAEIDVALHAAGASPHALASSLDGHAGLAVVDGELSNAVLAAAFGDLLRSAGTGLDPAGRSHVRCLAVRADATNGRVTLTALKLDTTRLSLDGSGTLNLADETMALRLHPTLRLGGAGVSAPLRLDGGLRHPAVALEAAPGTGRVGVTFGGLAGPADNCAPELTAARDGHAGPLPVDAPGAGKPPKPADLLRKLLR